MLSAQMQATMKPDIRNALPFSIHIAERRVCDFEQLCNHVTRLCLVSSLYVRSLRPLRKNAVNIGLGLGTRLDVDGSFHL